MFENLLRRATELADQARAARIERLAGELPPPGVTIAHTPDGVILSGKRLRRRFVTDASLRSLGR